ncbi:MAG: glycosyltransferase family 61 protein [Rhodobacteraceae bacterium]|jgi:capsular polysaccharide biosynthesis protein|nr:glycosyltransferase family 61 protein [Paracoccaceae bacterium]
MREPIRPMAQAQGVPDPGTPPRPDGGWSCAIRSVAGALAIPPATSAMVQAAGVLDRDGAAVPEGVTWRGTRPMLTPPDMPADIAPGSVAHLPGRHLYAGQLWAHFGHFLCESLSRLWALDKVGPLDGIVFLPKRPGTVQALSAWQREMLDLFDLRVPVRVLDRPTRIDDLIVPGQGFGIGPMFAGTPAFRDFVRDRFARGVAPDGPDRLYLSRSGLGGAEGGILAERQIEARMEAAGYTVFHPQKHPISAQVAAYRAARAVVGPDGSAFHLLAFADPAPRDVAVIRRRSSGVADGIATHVAAFTGRAPRMIDALVADWVPEGSGRANRNAFGQVDFAQLQAALTESGFIAPAPPWPAPRFRDIRAEAEGRATRRHGLTLVRKLRHKGGRALAGIDGGTRAATATGHA